MARIGIVTIIDYYNFGNRLQNYAVSYVLSNRFDCKVITLEGYSSPVVQGNFLSWLKEQILLQFCRFPMFSEKYLSSKGLRWFNFSKWSRRWIPRRRFYSCHKLPSSLKGQFDLFVSGSDQVWNYRIKNLRIEDFFLTFADEQQRNSISASFGVEELPEDKKKYYRDRLRGFNHISVREDSGAKIVKELLGEDVPVLVDPVMMLSQDEWIKVEKKPRVDITKPYILKYYLGEEDTLIDGWAKQSGYVVYELMNEKKKELYAAGPGEFLSLIRNATLVCSDSFHCIAFAILFSRPFIVFERQGSENYMGSRLETLLGKFGFQNRWSQMLKPEEYLEIDFGHVKDLLKAEQNKFMKYLSEILEGK